MSWTLPLSEMDSQRRQPSMVEIYGHTALQGTLWRITLGHNSHVYSLLS